MEGAELCELEVRAELCELEVRAELCELEVRAELRELEVRGELRELEVRGELPGPGPRAARTLADAPWDPDVQETCEAACVKSWSAFCCLPSAVTCYWGTGDPVRTGRTPDELGVNSRRTNPPQGCPVHCTEGCAPMGRSPLYNVQGTLDVD